MSLLTDREIEQLSEGIAIDDFNHDLARRVEAAVLQKLATVSVEWPESASSSHEVYLREQIEPMLAAARVQALEEFKADLADALCADCENGVKYLNEQAAEKFRNDYPKVSALIVGKDV